MTTVNLYRLYCDTELDYVTVWSTITPTVCPNNNTHTIGTDIDIINTISTDNVLITENTNGDFETTHVKMDIPSGTPGDITEHDVTWPMDILLWKTILTPNTEMIGDEITVVAAPETTVGAVVAPVNIGDTVLYVNPEIFDYIVRGYLMTIDDGVNKNVLGRLLVKDPGAGTITVQTPTTHAFNPGTPVKLSIYVLKDIFIENTNTIEIAGKGMKGKIVPMGIILRVYYTNNSGTSKIFRFRPEYYNNG